MVYERKCPKCGCLIKHKSKYNRRDAHNEKRSCLSCRLKGISQKELYGDKYDEIIKKRNQSLKQVEHTWHDKIAESRRKNGTHKLSEEHKRKISENTIFSESGENHVRIKKILEEHNITYEQYLNRLDDYTRYKREVRRITNKQPLTGLENYDKRGRTGVVGAYHLDHKIEISEGYIKGISPEIIGDIKNLQMIPWEKNMTKRKYPNGIHDNKIKNYYGKG